MFNPWWTFTDPGKTGTCDRCKRPASEHNHICVACNKVLAPGDAPTFALHSYRDHKPGMKHSSSTVCTCPQAAILAFIASMPAPVPVVKTATGGVAVVQPTLASGVSGASGGPAALPPGPVATPQRPVAPRPAAPPKPRDPDDDSCACGGCGACTAGNECFRPSEGGCGGKCIVCYGMGLLGPPVPQAASPVVPLPGQAGPVKIIQPTIVQPGVAAPAPPPLEAPEVRCACVGCAACTKKTECWRPPEVGGRCMVCYGISLVPAPTAPSLPTTTPFESSSSPSTTPFEPSPPTTPLQAGRTRALQVRGSAG